MEACAWQVAHDALEQQAVWLLEAEEARDEPHLYTHEGREVRQGRHDT